ncbi:MAG: hypothetical protein HY360_22500 [Verrucomicrobia bacterium]|nr:hypothetical protein [Verrucomicrobiota bacterium]
MHELDVECLPKDLPDRIEVDVSALQIGSNIHVSHIKAPPGVTILSHADVPVFTVLAPTKEEVVVASTELTEPEVIKQKKAEEGEEAGAKTEGKAGAKPEGRAGAKPADGKAAETKGAEGKAGAKASDAKAAAKPAGKPAAKSEKK